MKTYVFRLTERVLAAIAGTALLVMMVLTLADVIGRYGFHKSIFGTAEIVEIFMVFAVFAGLAFVTASNEHITVTIFEGWILRRAPNLQRWATQVFSAVVYAVVTWELGAQTLAIFETGRRTAVLDLPQWILPAAATALSAVGVALFAIAIVRTRAHPELIDPYEHDDGKGI